MRKLSVKDIAKDGVNCYSLVVGISKRARQISEKAEEEGELLEEKPVKMAIRDFIEDRVEIVPPTAEQIAEDEGEEDPAARYGKAVENAAQPADEKKAEAGDDGEKKDAEQPAGGKDGRDA